MRIIYDISWLGESYLESAAASGVSRVIENVATGLVASPECEVSFCASRSLKAVRGSLDYLKSQPKFEGVPFLATKTAKLSKALDNRLRDLNTEIDGAAVTDLLRNQDLSWASAKKLKLHKRIERQVLARSGRAVEEQKPFDLRWLARADIFHSPIHPVPRQVRGVRRFLTFYDIIPILYPGFCVPGQLKFTNAVLQSIESEDWVICISQATRNDLCNHVSIDPARVFVTHLAAAPELFYPCDDRERIASARTQYHIPDGPYILSLNNLEPRKNIGHVVRCFAKLVQEENINDLNLVLVGAKGWLYDEILETISAYDSLRDRIIVTDYVADEHLAALYSDALAFVFPSFYEGFGLPALEAMQCGVPVITSNTSSLPEVVGDAGLMVEPEDVDGLCDAILQVYRSAFLREAMSRKSLERSKQFSWDKSVQETISAYKVALAD
jgi:glycosyltransferase involved in cell wall biosynthesis